MLFTARPKNEVKVDDSNKSPPPVVVVQKTEAPFSPTSATSPTTLGHQMDNEVDSQKKAKEAEHYIINFFVKKENLKASLLLEHLSRYNDHTNGYKGCWQFLCNKLYDLEMADIEFYLPQLM